MGIKQIRITYVTFLECELRGNWINIEEDLEYDNMRGYADKSVDRYSALRKKCEVNLVRPDGMRRIFQFSKGSEIVIMSNCIRFNQNDVVDEHSVDEDKLLK